MLFLVAVMRRSTRILILLLVMAHTLRLFFQGWSKEGIWLFIADALIVLLILRDDLWKLYTWLRHQWEVTHTFELTCPKADPEFTLLVQVIIHRPIEIRNFKFRFTPFGVIFIDEASHVAGSSVASAQISTDRRGGIAGAWDTPQFLDTGDVLVFAIKYRVSRPGCVDLNFRTYDAEENVRTARRRFEFKS